MTFYQRLKWVGFRSSWWLLKWRIQRRLGWSAVKAACKRVFTAAWDHRPGYWKRRCRHIEETLFQTRRQFDAYANRLVELSKEVSWLRSLVIKVRVAQAEPPRVGWEVMAYIPEEVIQKVLADQGPMAHNRFERLVMRQLLAQAIRGIHHVRQNGKVTAYVFSPVTVRRVVDDRTGETRVSIAAEDGEWARAVFEKDGGYKMSGKLQRLPTAAERERDLKRFL